MSQIIILEAFIRVNGEVNGLVVFERVADWSCSLLRNLPSIVLIAW